MYIQCGFWGCNLLSMLAIVASLAVVLFVLIRSRQNFRGYTDCVMVRYNQHLDHIVILLSNYIKLTIPLELYLYVGC